jgi:hypothetical protein
MSKKNHSSSEPRAPDGVSGATIATIVVAVLGVVSAVAVAYFQFVVPQKLSIEATQTAEAKLRLIAPAVTLTPSATSTPTPTRTPTPTPKPIAFQDFEENNGTPPGGGNYFWDAWFTRCSFSAPPNVYEGQRAVRCEAQARAKGDPKKDSGGTVGINPASIRPIDLSNAKAISVWVYDTQGNNNIELKLRDDRDRVSNKVWSDKEAAQNTWTEITWRLSDFAGIDMTRIKNIEFYERNDGMYYFDFISYR